MKKLLLPLILALLGTGGGIGAGLFLGAAPAPHDAAAADTCAPAPGDVAAGPAADLHAAAPADHGAATDSAATGHAAHEYAKLNNQFVVPVVKEGKVKAMVILSLNVEVVAGAASDVLTNEPKLRDLFLQVLFDHANIGGFDGDFTSSGNMRALRTALREAAQSVLGDRVSDVLIIDMVRQDV